ncbi:transglutaminase-like domain-containing protein [Sphingomonas sp. IC081]|mgnify:CR=1 FL=1|jgi:regulator of sirC expression with transglutaminase-like and TPR domain|uniref:transglutaminase family protein n=1 Tax=Sphingomonas sp. IC081 TaxID=304378 RepID=UPI00115B781F|nr:transglutaminase-like domain-containing protein [Sphingomonas sp. IC081]QDK31728.1 hypothetical protein DM450_02770 [Sphingomonas sp. IC081]
MDISVIGVLDDQDILLDIAALALSQLDHAECDVGTYLAQLEAIEDGVCEEGRGAIMSSEQAIVLAEVLHDEHGFTGDAESYDAPVNADFIRVLDRKRGLPISLAILYVAMARRAGWVAHVLNGPGHVLVQIGEKNPVIIDPFNGGRHVGADEFTALYQGHAIDVDMDGKLLLVPMTNHQVLARLLFNQAVRAESENDTQRAIVLHDRITRIAPRMLDSWHHLARLQISTNDSQGARATLLGIAELTGDKHARDQVMAVFRSLGPAR